jgi:diacylglycerol kinase (ATP)
MRATLVLNPQAGAAADVSADELLEGLTRAGFETDYQPTASEHDLDRLLNRPADLVVIAGGDGTVRAVTGRILGRGMPITIVPLGTGNNIGAALGLTDLPVHLLLNGLSAPKRWAFDLGLVHSPWGTSHFLESSGVGMFADLLQAYDPTEGRSLRRALRAAAQVVPRFAARDLRVVVDGTVLAGRYLLVEMMNTAYLGMRTPIAPAADPGDGMLDVVLVEERGDVGFASYLRQLATGDPTVLPNWNVRRARRVTLMWEGSVVHADEEILPSGDPTRTTPGALIEFALLPGALEVWLPGRCSTGRS